MQNPLRAHKYNSQLPLEKNIYPKQQTSISTTGIMTFFFDSENNVSSCELYAIIVIPNPLYPKAQVNSLGLEVNTAWPHERG